MRWLWPETKNTLQTGHNAEIVQGAPDNHVFHHNLLIQAAPGGAQAVTSYIFSALFLQGHTIQHALIAMILDKFLSKFTSFATYSDVADPIPSPMLEEDSDTSVFSEDEEYEEVRVSFCHN